MSEVTDWFRQVWCDGPGSVADPLDTVECADGLTFIADNNTQCYEPSSAAARSACEITIDCGLDAISVYVSDAAIWQQTDAPLQFGDSTSGQEECQIAHQASGDYYSGSMSLDPNE